MNGIIKSFAATAKQFPQQIAVSHNDFSLTYAALEKRVNHCFFQLSHLGVTSSDRIVLFAENEAHNITALLSVFSIQAIYVPIYARFSTQVITNILSEVKPKFILTYSQYLHKLPHAVKENIILIDDLLNMPIPNISTTLYLNTVVNLMRPTYIMYTSGSTGLPKGVLGTEYALIKRLEWFQKKSQLSPRNIVANITSISWDPYFIETLMPLMYGAQIDVFDTTLFCKLDILSKRKINFVHIVPSYFNITVKYQQTPYLGLNTLFLGGETLSKLTIENAKKCFPNAKIYNIYGPTEATLYATCFDCTPEVQHDIIPIGQVISDCHIYLLDEKLQPVKNQTPGEIYIGNDSALALGYFNDKTMTKNRFLPNPFIPGERIYKTGDMAFYLPNGDLQFLARNDRQIKLRGLRMEPKEIEDALEKHTHIKNAYACLKDEKLTAYYEADEAIESLCMHEFLSNHLSTFLIPSVFIHVKIFPRLHNNKIDIKKLSLINAYSTSYASYASEESTSTFQEKLTSIVELAMDISPISAHAPLINLGLESLSILEIILGVEKNFSVSIDYQDIFQAKTLHGLTSCLLKKNRFDANKVKIEVNDSTTFPLFPPQKRFWQTESIEPIPVDHITIVYDLAGELNEQRFSNAVRQVMENNKILRVKFFTESEAIYQTILDSSDIAPPATFMAMNVEEAKLFIHNDISKRFEFGTGPLFSITVIQTSLKQFLLYFKFHHIISDGWSINLFANALSASYNGDYQKALIDNKPQYFDLHFPKTNHDFWKHELANIHEMEKLPYDFEPTSHTSTHAKIVKFIFTKKESQQIKLFCKENGITLFSLFMHAIGQIMQNILLGDNLLFGVIISNRHIIKQPSVMGPISNLIPLVWNKKLYKNANAPLLLHQKILSLLSHSEMYTFDLVKQFGFLEETRMKPKICCHYHHANPDNLTFDQSVSQINYEIMDHSFIASELDFELYDYASLLFTIKYRTELFKEETIKQLGTLIKKEIKL